MFLAVDIGTSELKTTVFNACGDSLCGIRSNMPANSATGHRAELEPETIWRAVRQGIERLSPKIRANIKAAAISCHGESFVVLDAQGNPAGNAILNIDSRAVAEMAEFESFFGRERLYRKTGLPPHPMYTLPKIAWLRKHQPDQFARSCRFLCLEDYILYRLGIEPAISKSLASRTLGFDIQKGAWDSSLLQFTGIQEHQLSRCEPSGKTVGTAAASISRELGLPADIVWCTGGHDQACACVGAGAVATGTIADGTGTFECASIPLSQALVSSQSLAANLPCENHTISGQFLTLAYVPAGIALKWLRDSFFQTASYTYDDMLAGLPEDPTGIFCFPYFLGTGTPWLDNQAKAAIYGLTDTTKRNAIVQSVLEGVSYEMRRNFEVLRVLGIGIERILATGGGAKSDAWLQLKSDIFGCPLVHVPGEASSRGAAICASVAIGTYRNWNEAVAAMVKPGRTFEPRPAMQRCYDELFEEYKQLANRLFGYRVGTGKN